MKKLIILSAVMLCAVGIAVLLTVGLNDDTPFPGEVPVPGTGGKPGKTLQSFRSQKELDGYLRRLAKKMESSRSSSGNANTATADKKESDAAPSASPSSDESVTNVQHAGVDEGGIVKLHGDHLIVLRRGRLFTVSINDNSLRPVSSIDAFAPDINPQGTWYDEMLVAGDTIAVIGYSYQRGGTEIGLFNIDARGNLSYRSTYHLRSNDYYSSRNYASRLIGNKLIFYTPMYLWLDGNDPSAEFPALRKWRKGVTDKEFRPIFTPTRIYRPARNVAPDYGLALHTVTVCDLGSRNFNCEATGVIGPSGRVFYVSPDSVYVWATDWLRNPRGGEKTRSMLYRMPLDGSAPMALGVSGSPVDQFSFLESNDGHLNVLVRSEGEGDGMWKGETTNGDAALLRIPRDSFSDGSQNAPASQYRELPKIEGYTVQNRYVGDYLLYGTGNSWGYPDAKDRSALYAVRWASGDAFEIQLGHSVDRIEAMGKDAVIVGTDEKNLYFSPIRLGKKPVLKARYTRQNASQGELRSHGFFYKTKDKDSGLLGLPIREEGRPGYESLFEGSASILFLRNDSLNFRELGTLAARPAKQADDRCRASCVDWYGNARPLFIRGRVFALLGYEIVEGTLTANGIREKRRRSFSPALPVRTAED